MLELQSATQEIDAPGGRGRGSRRGRRGRVFVRPGPRRVIGRRPWRRPWWRPWWWWGAPPPPAPLLPLAVNPVAPVAQPYYYYTDPRFVRRFGRLCGAFWCVFFTVLIIVAASQSAAVVQTYSYSYGVG